MNPKSIEDPFTYDQVYNKSVSHQIIDLKNDRPKAIELKCIVLDFVETKEISNLQKFYRYLIADETGSVVCNFFQSSA